MSPLPINDRLRLARSLSRVENRDGDWHLFLEHGLRDLNDCRTIGVTGPPGAGKSTLINAMSCHWAERGSRVAILAVDPSSPFSGGAILGDRIRMPDAEANDNVFVRSVSARGQSGGVSRALIDLGCIFASNGFDRIIIETIGVGQNEIDIAFASDCTLVTCVPGLGDSVQAAKAGIMEIGDIYCVNKSDLPGAERVSGDILGVLGEIFPGEPGANPVNVERHVPVSINSMAARRFGFHGEVSFWHPPVMQASARDSTTITALCNMIDEFWRWLEESGTAAFRDNQRSEHLLSKLLEQRLLDDACSNLASQEARSLQEWASLINGGDAGAYDVVDTIIAQLYSAAPEA